MDVTDLMQVRCASDFSRAKRLHLILLLAALCLSSVGKPAVAEATGEAGSDTSEALRKEIISAWKLRESTIAGCKIHLKLDTFTSAQMLRLFAGATSKSSDTRTSTQVIVSIGDEGQLRLDVTGDVPAVESGKLSNETKSVWNAGTLKHLSSMPATGARFGKIAQKPLPFTEASYTPIYWSCAPFRYQINSIPIASNSTSISSYTYRAKQCVRVFDAEHLRNWILDPTCDMSVVLYENHDENGHLSSRITIEYDYSPANGFLPKSWHLVYSLSGRGLMKDVKALVTKKELQAEFPANYFDIDFPPGTYIRETSDTGQERHYVKRDNPKDEVTIRIMGPPTESLKSIESTRVKSWLVIVNVGVILILCLLLLYRWRGTTAQPFKTR